MCLKCTSRS